MDSLLAIFALESLLVIVPTLGLAWVIGFLSGRSGRRQLLEEQDRLRESAERAERQTGDPFKRTIAKMRRELDTVANLALAMPRVVRDLNRDDVDPADIPKLILRLANAVFEPKQLLLYGMRKSAPGSTENVLTLSLQKGLEEIPDTLKTVSVGQGKIGWVAKHELDMLKGDWDALRITDRLDVPDNHPLLKADIIGPLVHHRKQGQQILGVLCIGGPRIRPREEKLMLQLVTNFASLALVSTWNMKAMRNAAHHDSLTGLLNKRCFLGEAATNLLVQCEQSAKPFSIFIFDIDHFKNFNDTNGHPAGDDLLRRMGELIREHLQPDQLACRYGGEEFVIGMPGMSKQRALEQADRLRAAIEDEAFDHRESQPGGKVGVSGGIAEFPKDGASVAELVQCADRALYCSKEAGRNRVTLYEGLSIGDPGGIPSVIGGVGETPAEIDRPLR